MIHLTENTPILLATQAADFRKGIDGFVAVCSQQLHQDPRCGTLFVFVNRPATMIRILAYETNGFYLITKRLSRGRFKYWPRQDGPLCSLQAHKLRQLLLNELGA